MYSVSDVTHLYQGANTYMHAKIKYSKTNAIKMKKKHTYAEVGIYKAAQRSMCPTEMK